MTARGLLTWLESEPAVQCLCGSICAVEAAYILLLLLLRARHTAGYGVTAGQGFLVVWYCSTLTGFWNDKLIDKQEVCRYVKQWLWTVCRLAKCAAQCVWCWFVHVTRTHYSVGCEVCSCRLPPM